MSAIFETRSQEVLGINTSVSQQRRRSVADGFYALAGCEANEPQWNCHGAESRMHVMLGAFVVYSEAQLDQVQRLRVGGILERVGDGSTSHKACTFPRRFSTRRTGSIPHPWTSFAHTQLRLQIL